MAKDKIHSTSRSILEESKKRIGATSTIPQFQETFDIMRANEEAHAFLSTYDTPEKLQYNANYVAGGVLKGLVGSSPFVEVDKGMAIFDPSSKPLKAKKDDTAEIKAGKELYNRLVKYKGKVPEPGFIQSSFGSSMTSGWLEFLGLTNDAFQMGANFTFTDEGIRYQGEQLRLNPDEMSLFSDYVTKVSGEAKDKSFIENMGEIALSLVWDTPLLLATGATASGVMKLGRVTSALTSSTYFLPRATGQVLQQSVNFNLMGLPQTAQSLVDEGFGKALGHIFHNIQMGALAGGLSTAGVALMAKSASLPIVKNILKTNPALREELAGLGSSFGFGYTSARFGGLESEDALAQGLAFAATHFTNPTAYRRIIAMQNSKEVKIKATGWDGKGKPTDVGQDYFVERNGKDYKIDIQAFKDRGEIIETSTEGLTLGKNNFVYYNSMPDLYQTTFAEAMTRERLKEANPQLIERWIADSKSDVTREKYEANKIQYETLASIVNLSVMNEKLAKVFGKTEIPEDKVYNDAIIQFTEKYKVEYSDVKKLIMKNLDEFRADPDKFIEENKIGIEDEKTKNDIEEIFTKAADAVELKEKQEQVRKAVEIEDIDRDVLEMLANKVELKEMNIEAIPELIRDKVQGILTTRTEVKESGRMKEFKEAERLVKEKKEKEVKKILAIDKEVEEFMGIMEGRIPETEKTEARLTKLATGAMERIKLEVEKPKVEKKEVEPKKKEVKVDEQVLRDYGASEREIKKGLPPEAIERASQGYAWYDGKPRPVTDEIIKKARERSKADIAEREARIKAMEDYAKENNISEDAKISATDVSKITKLADSGSHSVKSYREKESEMIKDSKDHLSGLERQHERWKTKEPKPEKTKSKVDDILAELKTKEEEAEIRIGRAGLQAGIDPALMRDYAIVGAHQARGLIQRGVEVAKRFAEWSKNMVTQLGESVKPFLKNIWDNIKAYATGEKSIGEPGALGLALGGIGEGGKGKKPVTLYRGISKGVSADVDVRAPREGYQATATTSKDVAASYSGEEGQIAKLELQADKIIEFPVTRDKSGMTDFSKVGFDERASKLKPGEVLVARDVVDIGPLASLKVDPESKFSYTSDVYAWKDKNVVRIAVDEGQPGGEQPTKPPKIVDAIEPQPPQKISRGETIPPKIEPKKGAEKPIAYKTPEKTSRDVSQYKKQSNSVEYNESTLKSTENTYGKKTEEIKKDYVAEANHTRDESVYKVNKPLAPNMAEKNYKTQARMELDEFDKVNNTNLISKDVKSWRKALGNLFGKGSQVAKDYFGYNIPPVHMATISKRFGLMRENGEAVTRGVTDQINRIMTNQEVWNNFAKWDALTVASRQHILKTLANYEKDRYLKEIERDLTWEEFYEYGKFTKNERAVLEAYRKTLKAANEQYKDVMGKAMIATDENVAKYLTEGEMRKYVEGIGMLEEVLNKTKNLKEMRKKFNEFLKEDEPFKEEVVTDLLNKKFAGWDEHVYYSAVRPTDMDTYIVEARREKDVSHLPVTELERLSNKDLLDRFYGYAESKMQSNEMLSRLQEMGFETSGYQIKELIKEKRHMGVLTEMQLMELASKGHIELDNEILDRLVDSAKRGVNIHTIHKEFIPGMKYTEIEFKNQLGRFVRESVHSGYKPYYLRMIDRQLAEWKIDVNQMVKNNVEGAAKEMGFWKNAQAYVNQLKQPEATYLDNLRFAAISWHVGMLKPGFWVQQMTQSLQTGLPQLLRGTKEAKLSTGEAYKSFGKAWTELPKYALALLNRNRNRVTLEEAVEQFNSGAAAGIMGGINVETLRLIEKLQSSGHVSSTGITELMALSPEMDYQHKVGYKSYFDKFKNVVSYMGKGVEKMSRAQVALAFIDIANKAKMNEADLLKFTKEGIDKAMGEWGKGGRVSLLYNKASESTQGELVHGLRKSVLTYKTFSFYNFGQWNELIREKQFSALYAKSMIGLGLHGLFKFPLFASMFMIADLFTEDDIDYEMYKLSDEMDKLIPGVDSGKILTKGLTSLFGADMSDMFAEDTPLLTDIFARAWGDTWQDKTEHIAWGASVGFAKDMIDGTTDLVKATWNEILDKTVATDGNEEKATRAVRKMLPVFARNIWAAFDYDKDGIEVRGKSVVIRDDLTAWDIYLKMASFPIYKEKRAWLERTYDADIEHERNKRIISEATRHIGDLRKKNYDPEALGYEVRRLIKIKEEAKKKMRELEPEARRLRRKRKHAKQQKELEERFSE